MPPPPLAAQVCTVKPKVTIKCALYYKVKAGDTCWSIATASGLSIQQVQALNPTAKCKALQVGSSACVRDGGNKITPAPADMVYCVKAAASRAADTCRAFAARYEDMHAAHVLRLLQGSGGVSRLYIQCPSGAILVIVEMVAPCGGQAACAAATTCCRGLLCSQHVAWCCMVADEQWMWFPVPCGQLAS
jgi:hypothetical protein